MHASEAETQASIAVTYSAEFSWAEMIKHSAILGALAYLLGAELSALLGVQGDIDV
jgi:hypothetical protein